MARRSSRRAARCAWHRTVAGSGDPARDRDRAGGRAGDLAHRYGRAEAAAAVCGNRRRHCRCFCPTDGCTACRLAQLHAGGARRTAADLRPNTPGGADRRRERQGGRLPGGRGDVLGAGGGQCRGHGPTSLPTWRRSVPDCRRRALLFASAPTPAFQLIRTAPPCATGKPAVHGQLEKHPAHGRCRQTEPVSCDMQGAPR